MKMSHEDFNNLPSLNHGNSSAMFSAFNDSKVEHSDFEEEMDECPQDEGDNQEREEAKDNEAAEDEVVDDDTDFEISHDLDNEINKRSKEVALYSIAVTVEEEQKESLNNDSGSYQETQPCGPEINFEDNTFFEPRKSSTESMIDENIQ